MTILVFEGGEAIKQIVNFFITGLILWLAAWLFSQFMQIDGMVTLVLATLLLFIAEVVVVIAFFTFIASSVLAQFWAEILACVCIFHF